MPFTHGLQANGINEEFPFKLKVLIEFFVWIYPAIDDKLGLYIGFAKSLNKGCW